jgi:hypothetical protein
MPQSRAAGKPNPRIRPRRLHTFSLYPQIQRTESAVSLSASAYCATSGKRISIRAAAIDHRQRHFQQSEVDRQLPPMVIPVVQHDRP